MKGEGSFRDQGRSIPGGEGGKTASSCGYQGHEFGASYPDSICLDGYLWDADSCDEPGGGLTHGGDMACPRCNTAKMLAAAAEEAADGSCGESMWQPWDSVMLFEGAARRALVANPAEAAAVLSMMPSFSSLGWPDRTAVLEGRASWEEVVDVTIDPPAILKALAAQASDTAGGYPTKSDEPKDLPDTTGGKR